MCPPDDKGEIARGLDRLRLRELLDLDLEILWQQFAQDIRLAEEMDGQHAVAQIGR